MKNLKINSINRLPLQVPNKISGIVINDGSVYYLNKNGEFCSVQDNQEIVLAPELYENLLVELEYLEFENRIWFATKDRLIFYCPKTESLTCIPLINAALCMAWNPTKEILAIVYEDLTVATCSVDLENAILHNLDSTTLNANVPSSVYVGWGSADTQFRGSEGKLKKKVEQIELIEIMDKIPRITWRGNGEMFAVNYWKDGQRSFKVFQQDCKPLYESEKVTGLQSVIAWRPEGNMIANTVCLSKKYSVFIFEKNGYKRFNFDLIYDNYEVTQLKWSNRGEILAVCQQNYELNETYLSLYTTSNYKWFLKQYFCFNNFICFTWTAALGPLLNLQICTQRDVLTYEYQMSYDVFEDDCAVIDGKNVHLTRFQSACLPPPMSQITISLENAVNFVVFGPEKSQIAIVDYTWQVSVYNFDTNTLLDSFKILLKPKNDDYLFYYNFRCLENILYCLAASGNDVCLVSLDGKSERMLDRKIRNFCSTKNGILFHLNNEIFVEDEANFSIPLELNGLLLQSVYCKIAHESYVFSLTTTNSFYVNEQCVSNSVTSFIVFQDKYLLLTTTKNLMFCIQLSLQAIHKLNQLNENFYNRPMEQGGRLVCGVKNTSIVVLQIPRGNLEIISCRLIAIDLLEELLKSDKWSEALHFVRTDRLNFNLLIDLNPDRFLENIEKFVEACETSAVLNSFIQEIEEQNVLETIYSKCNYNGFSQLLNKRTKICNALLEYFEKIDYTKYAIPIVTIAIYHFNVEMALGYIQDLLEHFPETETTATQAVKTLIIHTKHEGEDYLFKKSLQLYDTKLTRYICSFTQMDPKLYQPFLNELDTYSEVKRRFTINLHLKKPELAVQYLIRDETLDFSDILKYLESNSNVLPTIYGYYKKEDEIFQSVSKLYGKFLYEKKLHIEAATVFKLAELWNESFQQYKLANDWQAALDILDNKLQIVDKLKRNRIIEEIVHDLISVKRYKEAAKIQEERLNDYENAIETLLSNYHFQEALFLSTKHKRKDIVLHDIIPTVEKYCLNLETKLLENKKHFYEYSQRLFALRAAKIQKVKANQLFTMLIDDQVNLQGSDVDLYSDAGTVTTFRSTSSRSSTKSSRNRRKEERKKQDLREGGVYEDIALIRALHVLYEEIFKMGTDIRELCLVLVELDMRKDGKYLHDLLKEFQKEMRENVQQIWPDLSSADPANMEQKIISENFHALDDKYKNPPCSDNSLWELVIFS